MTMIMLQMTVMINLCLPKQFQKNKRNMIKIFSSKYVNSIIKDGKLTRRKTTKLRNAFANNMSTDIKLSKAHISKLIQAGGSFASWLANLGKEH